MACSSVLKAVSVATCQETANTGTGIDAAACAAVADLDDGTKCLEVMKDGVTPAAAACTYTPREKACTYSPGAQVRPELISIPLSH